jgi:hypothetical protein
MPRPSLRAARLLVVCLGAIIAGGPSLAVAQASSPAPVFAALVERLSEPGGDFGGDNLISNEQSYLHVMPALQQAGVRGGAYVGVGPDQNFSYLAQIRPAIAYLIDLRRDNLLLHLLFKALCAEASTRVEYLCLLTGRPAPENAATWSTASIDAIIAHVDHVAVLPEAELARRHARQEEIIRACGIPLSAADLGTIGSIRRQFAAAGLSLVFLVRGRPPNPAYPTLRTLLRETDGAGHQLGFLATEAGFQFVRSLHAQDRIVPVVGDVSGPHAMRAIAADMKARGLRLAAFYISNVEYYLYRTPGAFDRYVSNLRELPHDEKSTIIRSVFPSGGSRKLPQAVPGYYSVSLVQPFRTMLADLAAGKYRSYQDLIRAGPP